MPRTVAGRRPLWLTLSRIAALVGAVSMLTGVAFGPADAAPTVNFPAPTPVDFAVERGQPTFLVRCVHSHFAAYDPIVFPRQPGAAHEHEFFGSVTTNASSTVQSLVNGANTCSLTDDDSGYWFPAMYEGGERVEADKVSVYYRTMPGERDTVTPFPVGFRLIAGNSQSTVPQSVVRYNCGPGTPDKATPPKCPGGEFNVFLDFPECSNGQLDSTDHKSHMAYRTLGNCPATHPILLPTIRAIVRYPSNGGNDVAFSSGSPTTFHGDFMNAWNPVTLTRVIRDCLIAGVSCGEVRDD
ncbi:DUF1996 domain-containing protein [soil metagenome]